MLPEPLIIALAGFLVLALAIYLVAAHASANVRTLYLTRNRDQVARYIPPIRT